MSKETILYTVIAKDSSWFAKVDETGVQTLLTEHAVKLKENKETTYQTLYTDKELKSYIKMREREKCVFCEKKGEKFHWLIPKEEGGFETPINLVLACEPCQKEQKEQYKEQKEQYIEEANIRKQTNLQLMQREEDIVCEQCQVGKKTEAFKFINKKGDLAYCIDCYKNNSSNFYFLMDEQHDYIGKTTKENAQELWNEGKVEYLDKNIAKVFENSKKQRCVLCRKMKWKSSFKKNEQKDRRVFCRKCQLEKAEEGLYNVFDYQHKKVNLISLEEAKSLTKKGIGKIVSDNGFKIPNMSKTYLYHVYVFYQKLFQRKHRYFLISLSGKWSKRISEKERDELLSEKKAEVHNEQTIRLLIESEEW